jgi:hypothetical protein
MERGGSLVPGVPSQSGRVTVGKDVEGTCGRGLGRAVMYATTGRRYR